MNWLTSIFRNLTRKPYLTFLLVFSICVLSACGVLWACGWSEEDDTPFSVFNPGYFIEKTDKSFFFANDPQFGIDTTGIYNDNYLNNPITAEWDGYLNHSIPKEAVHYLLFKAGLAGVDSVRSYLNSGTGKLPLLYPATGKNYKHTKKVDYFFDYLLLAKTCEQFAALPKRDYYGWGDTVAAVKIPEGLDPKLSAAFAQCRDPFIKERLWFQCVRLAYFEDRTEHKPDTLTVATLGESAIVHLFDEYEGTFPKNLIYYRTMGYLAGYYYRHAAYATSNYLYSLCYANTDDLKWASNWSFHPQEEGDWQETLQMAKNKGEKIALWQLLANNTADNGRALKEIARLNPSSEKLNVLLSSVISTAEYARKEPVVDNEALDYLSVFPFTNDPANIKLANDHNDSVYNAKYTIAYKAAVSTEVAFDKNLQLVDSLSGSKFIAKRYYWHLAAGYLHYLHYDFDGAAKFYAMAKKELPAGDKAIAAQYNLLDIILYTKQVNHIDANVEAKLLAPLTWLANLRDDKELVGNLRFNDALTEVKADLSKLYLRQGEKIKAACFGYDNGFYGSYERIDSLVKFITNPDKPAYAQTIARYCPYKLQQLYYQQSLVMTYRENLDRAVMLMDKADTATKSALLYGNPFNSRLNDCHDCDHAAPQKKKYSRLVFLQTLKAIKDDLKAGKNTYRNAYLLANAYYNINYYGNARFFYEENISGFNNTGPNDVDGLQYQNMFTMQNIATKYYKQALKNAANDEQRALCTFMISKCERNAYYNVPAGNPATGGTFYGLDNTGNFIPDWPHFAVLANKYANTRYYAEVLKECGDFRLYADSIKKMKHQAVKAN